MSQIRVADISRWQGNINWDEFRKHIDGVVIKISGADGGLYVDGQAKRNQAEARRVGLPIWYYHYKGQGSPELQAQHMLAAIGGLRSGEAVVLDDENEAKVNVGFDAAFADYVKKHTGLNVIIYSNQSRFSGVDLTPLAKRDLGAWVAKYGANTGTVEGAGSPPSIAGMKIIMWQYTSQARVPGVTANTVDLNIFYGTVDQFRKYGVAGNVPAPDPVKPPTTPGNGVYVVVKGDTLSGIGQKLGLNWRDIARWNGIVAPWTIYPGQRLKVFGGSAGSNKPQPVGTYTVVSGDTLIGIGQKTGTNWRQIAELNGIREPYTIYPGQRLKLPGGGSAPAPVPTYTVQPGDYLILIEKKTGVAWRTIASLNGLREPYTIYPGQVLKLK